MKIFERIFSKKPSSPAYSMMNALEAKPIFKYKMLDRFTAANIDEIISNQAAFGTCRLIEETDKYWFYGFTPRLLRFVSDEYVLRRSKVNTDVVQFFGKSCELACVFEKWLCQADRSGSTPVIIKDIESGDTFEYKWFRPGKSVQGHFAEYDYINRMFADESHLIFDVGRYKGDFRNEDKAYDYTAEYYLIVEWRDGSFHAKTQVASNSDDGKCSQDDISVSDISVDTYSNIFSDIYHRAFSVLSTQTLAHNSEFELLPAMLVVADYSCLSANKKRHQIVNGLINYIFEKFGFDDASEKLFDERIGFYGAIIRGKPLRAEWLQGQLEVIQDADAIVHCATALGDILINPECANDYDNAPILLYSIFAITDFAEMYIKEIIPLFVELFKQIYDA